MNREQDVLPLEEAVLGYILNDNPETDYFLSLLQEEDFSHPHHKIVFNALADVFSAYQKIEDAAVIHTLKKQKKFKFIGGETKLFYLKSKAGLKSNIIPMIHQMEEYSKLRKTGVVISDISKKIFQADSADAILDELENSLLEITKGSTAKEFVNIDSVSQEVFREIITRRENPDIIKGVETSFSELDNYTLGFQKGDLVILAARPSMGKTAFALNLAVNVAELSKETVVVFSLEMPSSQLATRMLSMASNISANNLKNPAYLKQDDVSRIEKAQSRLAKCKILIDDEGGITLSEIQWKLRRLKRQTKNIQLVVIDYLQLITISSQSSDNRQLEVSKISRTLKQLARELDCPIVALSQLSRNVERREDKMPILSDLRESGAIEQDADLILFLYRELYYSKKLDPNAAFGKQDVIVNIAKHRNGATGKFTLEFDPPLGKFSDKKNSFYNEYNKGVS